MDFLAQKLNLPTLGRNLPGLGNKLTQTLGRLVLWAGGWRFEGAPPNNSKFVVIDAPHTSNWDAVWGFSVLFALGIKIHWMGKHTLFRNPFRKLLIWMGGIPVDRTASHGVVEQVVDEFSKRDKLVIGLTPEGTRKHVPAWKTGFYYMAMNAGAPIVMAFMDYERKVLGFGPVLKPSGDLSADMKRFEAFYAKVTGKRPENYNPSIYRANDTPGSAQKTTQNSTDSPNVHE